jgi:hypothetical protein
VTLSGLLKDQSSNAGMIPGAYLDGPD